MPKSENVSGANLNELSDIVPASITVKATSEEQVKSIVNMENNNDVQVVFAGRGEEAKKSYLTDNHGGKKMNGKIIAVCGGNGVGKSTICTNF